MAKQSWDRWHDIEMSASEDREAIEMLYAETFEFPSAQKATDIQTMATRDWRSTRKYIGDRAIRNTSEL